MSALVHQLRKCTTESHGSWFPAWFPPLNPHLCSTHKWLSSILNSHLICMLLMTTFSFLKIFKKNLFINERHRERQRHRQRQREKQAPCRKPDAGLSPGSPGSRPGLKADAQPLSHPGVLTTFSNLCHSYTLCFILEYKILKGRCYISTLFRSFYSFLYCFIIL